VDDPSAKASAAAGAAADERARSLLERVARGDDEGMGELYRLLEQPVYGFALRILNHPADASDVLNEVMLEVWKGAARFEGRSRVRTWALGIARHRALDRLRRRGREPDEEAHPELPDEAARSPLDLAEGVERAEQVRRCLDELSSAQSEVVYLAFFEDLPYPEIAKLIERPLGTVKTRVMHAKRALQRCLAALGGRGDGE